jgi:hypothetical protein
MKLVVVAFIFLMTLFTAKAPDGDSIPNDMFDESVSTVKPPETEIETEIQRLAREKRERIAARAAARKASGITGIRFSGDTKLNDGRIANETPPVPVVAGESGPENLSPEQIERLNEISDRPTIVFEHREGEGHPLSSPELVEKELTRNRELQAEIEKLSEVNPGRFEEELVKLKQQEEILINSQEFLAFCKESKSEVTFTGQELERIFALLDLPSLSEANLEEMSPYELGNLKGSVMPSIMHRSGESYKSKGSLKIALDFINSITIDGSVDRKKSEIRSVKTQVLDFTFPEDKKDILTNYLENRLNEVSRLLRIKSLKKDFSEEGIDSKSQEEFLLFLKKIDYKNADELSKTFQFVESKENYNEKNLSALVDNLLSSAKIGPEFQKLISSRILENLDKKDLTPEQKQFVRKIIKQTEAFSNLNAQATEAIDANDVVRMQELQDELRDCYEDVIRNNWKDQELTNIDGVFLQNIRKSINELLREFNEKARSFTGAAKGGKSFTERIKYKFKRLFVRLTFDTRKMRYRSELSVNKADFGLNLVDFKKAATDGYVATLKEKSEILANVLRKAQGSNLNETAETQALRDLKDQMKTFDFVVQEILALKGIASLGGTLPNAMVRNAFKVSELPDADSFDSTFLSNLKKSSGSRRYKDLMIGLLKMGDSHPELIKKFSEEGFLRLSKDEQEKMKEVFKTWRNKFTNESILSKSNSLISVKNLPDLRLLAEFNGASPEFMDVLRTPETAQYAVDAYKGDVVVPSGQAKSIVTQISSFIENITTAEKLLAPKKIENGSLLSLASEA